MDEDSAGTFQCRSSTAGPTLKRGASHIAVPEKVLCWSRAAALLFGSSIFPEGTIMLNRLIDNWVYGGFLGGLLLLLLSPLITDHWPAALTATFFCLPAYMLHQYEEHDKDRFRAFVNRLLGNGHEVLTRTAVFLINVPGVWGGIAVALWLAARVDTGFALIAIYLLLLNGIIHIAQAAAARSYNPGLITAIVLLIPVGGWGLVAVEHSRTATLAMHATGLAAAVAIHLAIIIPVLRNRRKYA
jgi:hypothetical protein